jgi:hypothetical protein
MKERKKHLKVFAIVRNNKEKVVSLEEFLPVDEKKDESVEIPLLDAFVHGFKMAFRMKFN